jgi:hypothetical protein
VAGEQESQRDRGETAEYRRVVLHALIVV